MDGAKKKLTKREQKAAAFKSGKKGKKAEAIVPLDVPEQDDGAVDDEGHKKLAIPPKTRPNKRKRDDAETTAVEGVPAKSEAVDGEQEGVDEPPKKKKRQRGGAKGKKKSLVDENGVRRRPLFVGNLPYNITAQMIQQHFAHSGETPTVRLLTPKGSSTSNGIHPSRQQSSAKTTKGCAFVEFTDANAIQAALKLHESSLGGRKINVELSAGGGGNSEARKKKIEDKNKRLNEEREKHRSTHHQRSTKTKKAETAEEKDGSKEEPLKTRVKTVVIGGQTKKVRDRRKPKVDQEGNEKVRKRKLEAKARGASGANAIRLG